MVKRSSPLKVIFTSLGPISAALLIANLVITAFVSYGVFQVYDFYKVADCKSMVQEVCLALGHNNKECGSLVQDQCRKVSND